MNNYACTITNHAMKWLSRPHYKVKLKKFQLKAGLLMIDLEHSLTSDMAPCTAISTVPSETDFLFLIP